jgi:hypothetical protein
MRSFHPSALRFEYGVRQEQSPAKVVQRKRVALVITKEELAEDLMVLVNEQDT